MNFVIFISITLYYSEFDMKMSLNESQELGFEKKTKKLKETEDKPKQDATSTDKTQILQEG